jgi:hypothetical protein
MNRISFLLRTALLSILMIGSFSSVESAHALGLSPVMFDYDLNPGESVEGIVRVENDTNSEQTYYTSAQNFIPNGESGQQTFIEDAAPSGLMTWIAFESPSVTLAAGEGRDVRWMIRIPEVAEPGGHYAAGFFSTQAPSAQKSVGVGAKTGVLFLVNVSGNIRESLEVESFNIVSRDLQERATFDRVPVHFDLRVRNTGSVHVKPEGVITVKNTLGNTVQVISVNDVNSRVLPGSVRRLTAEWSSPEASTDAGFFSELKSELSSFAIGRYTANVEIVYGRTGQKLEVVKTFWMFPWRVATVFFVGLMVLAILLKGYNRMVIRGAISKGAKK